MADDDELTDAQFNELLSKFRVVRSRDYQQGRATSGDSSLGGGAKSASSKKRQRQQQAAAAASSGHGQQHKYHRASPTPGEGRPRPPLASACDAVAAASAQQLCRTD